MAPRVTLLQQWGASFPKGRIQLVDELKGIALLLVVLYHIELAVMVPMVSHGYIGVDMFLILSGWTLGRSPRVEETAGTFFRKRFFRVLPAYWIALILFGVIKAQLFDGRINVETLVIHAFALQAFASPEHFFAINPSFWFVSILPVVYGLAFLFRRELSPWFWLCLGFGTGMLAYGVAAGMHHDFLGVFMAPRLVSFCAGYALALAMRPGDEPWRGRVLLALTAVAALYLEARGVRMLTRAAFAFSICVAYVLLRGAHQPHARWLRPSAALAGLGTLSYEIFLLHQPLLRLPLKLFKVQETAAARFASALAGMAVTYLAALLLNWALQRLTQSRPTSPRPLPSPST